MLDQEILHCRTIDSLFKLQPRGLGLRALDDVPRAFLLLLVFCFSTTFVGAIVAGVAFTKDYHRDPTRPKVPHDDDDDDRKDPGLTLALGIVVSLVGSLLTATGYCSQRLAHELTTGKSSSRTTNVPTYRHPLFLCGLLLLASGTTAAVVNLALLGQSITAPFAALTLLYNAFLAKYVLHERLSKWDVISSMLVIAGVAWSMIGVSLAQEDTFATPSHHRESLVKLKRVLRPLPVLYTVVTFGTLGLFGLVLHNKASPLKTLHPRRPRARDLLWLSLTAGTLSGFTSMCVKATLDLTLDGRVEDWNSPMPYLFVLGMPASLVCQLTCMNKGLQEFGTLKFVPLYHAFIILSNLTNGLVYFEEGRGYGREAMVLFVIGVVVTISGVMVLLAKVSSSGTRDRNSPGLEEVMTKSVTPC